MFAVNDVGLYSLKITELYVYLHSPLKSESHVVLCSEGRVETVSFHDVFLCTQQQFTYLHDVYKVSLLPVGLHTSVTLLVHRRFHSAK